MLLWKWANDNFTLFGNDNVLIIREFRIYDRWGELVFFTKDIPHSQIELGWDGTFKGKEVELGVYVYYFEIETVNGEIMNYAGDLTVIR